MGDIIQSFVQESLEFIIEVFGGNSQEALQQVGIQIASTVLLFLVVRFFFWNKVTDYLEQRKQMMKDEYDQAQQANQDASRLKAEAADELHEIRQSAKDLYDEAKQRGEDERKTIVDGAKEEAKRLIDNAHGEIQSELDKARAELNNEIVEVASLMAAKIIKREIDPKQHQDLIDEAADEVADS